MHVLTHFFAGWVASLPCELERRDRALVTAASVAPDVDGLVVVADLVQGRALDQCELYARYHHVLAHNLLFAVLATLACILLARRKAAVGALSFGLIHLHFLCDIVGSRGPDGSQWPVPYLLPFSKAWNLAVSWQWALNAWPNILFTVVLLAVTLYVAWARIAAQLGETGRAPGPLREAYDRGLPHWVTTHCDPDLEPLWNDPRFRSLVIPAE